MLRLRRFLRNLFVRLRVGGRDRCRRCGGRIRCRVRFLYLFRRGRRRFCGGGEGEDAGDVDCGAVGGAEDVVLVICSLAGALVRERCGTYDFGRDIHAGEFLHVFCAGFCAVVRDEDDLLAWADGQGRSVVG